MAEPLKNSFGPEVADKIAEMIVSVYPPFDRHAFLAQVTQGFDALELMDRARHISDALADHLPEDRREALTIVIDSLGSDADPGDMSGMGGFVYLPFVLFVADHGIEHFDEAMRAQYELTQRFTAEFSIRAFLERYPAETLAVLERWATDPSHHVRRLVSEGTRPRLPWAPRLRAFQEDPSPVLELLELLKDDSEEYVRRSVANNLNDISKDHPDVAIEVAERWLRDASDDRRRLVRHGLRTLIKAGDPAALELLGYGSDTPIRVVACHVTPEAQIGGTVRIEVELDNPTDLRAAAMVDLVVHFVKKNGSTSPKVFKGGEIELDGGEHTTVRKSISVRQHTTRSHHPGRHRVDVQVNGEIVPGGAFDLTE